MSTSDDALKGGMTAASTAGAVFTAVGATAVGAAAEAAAAVGIGAAIGTAIPVPLLGTAIGAAIGAITAAGIAISDALKDDFQPTPQQAAALLVLMRLEPALLFTGIDNATTPDKAAVLARYLRVVSGEVPTGALGNNGVWDRHSCSNPYICKADPSEPLTDPAFLQPIYDAVRKIGNYTIKGSDGSWHSGGWLTPGQHVDPNGDSRSWPVGTTLDFADGTQWRLRTQQQTFGLNSTDATWDQSGAAKSKFTDFIPSDIKSPADARTILGALRNNVAVFGAATGWSQVQNQLSDIAAEIRAVRQIAGEVGPDPVLASVFGDVTVPAKTAGGFGAKSAGGPGGYPKLTSTSGIWGAAAPTTTVLALGGAAAEAGSWWGVAAVVGVGWLVGGLLVYRERVKLRHGRLLAAQEARVVKAPGPAAFRRILERGLVDGDLVYKRTTKSRVPFDQAFHRMTQQYGLSATQLASTGRYFGKDVEPIQIHVHDDGSVHLFDGRLRYGAAKDAGAQKILAEVALLDGDGEEVATRTAVVRLV